MFKTKLIQNWLFVGIFVKERKVLSKIRKQMLQVWSRYFHLVFERLFSDFPFSRSLRHKTSTFDAYVEKVKRRRRKKKRKLAKRYINAYASHRIKKKKKRKLASDYRNAYASHRIKNVNSQSHAITIRCHFECEKIRLKLYGRHRKTKKINQESICCSSVISCALSLFVQLNYHCCCTLRFKWHDHGRRLWQGKVQNG
jgi:hypothetical protein